MFYFIKVNVPLRSTRRSQSDEQDKDPVVGNNPATSGDKNVEINNKGE